MLSDYKVEMDFFKYDGESCFPCCCCTHKKRELESDAHACQFCGHNPDQVETYDCSLCGEIRKRTSDDPGIFIPDCAMALLGPLCPDCFNNLAAFFSNK